MKKRFVGIVIGLMIILTVTSIAKPEWFSKLQLSPQVDTPLPNGITAYAYGGNGLLSKQKGTEVTYYHNDNLGSSAITTNSNGEVAYSTDYYPFGKAMHEQGNEKYKYNGKELDNTGLYYYGARYYDASLGRFISVDPVSGNIYNGQRLNRYSYTLNNPLKYVDVNGMDSTRPTVAILVADQYSADMVNADSNVNSAVIKEISELRKSYQSLGYILGPILVLPQSGGNGGDLMQEIAETFPSSRSFRPERLYSFLERTSISVLAISAHSSRDEFGNINAELAYYDSTLPVAQLDYNSRDDSYSVRTPWPSGLGYDVREGITYPCIEVYGCALAGPGGTILFNDAPKFAELRRYYSYGQILEQVDSSYINAQGDLESTLVVAPPTISFWGRLFGLPERVE